MFQLAIILFLISLPGEKADFWQEVRERYKKVNTIQGDFIQRVCSEEAGTCEEFRGRFYAQKPNLLRIEVSKPERQLIISDGESLSIQIEKKGVTKGPLTENPPFLLFFQLLTDSFLVKTEPRDKGIINITLAPVDTSYYSISLGVNRKDLIIKEVRFEDWSGNKTEIFFSKVALNKRLPKDIFKIR